jgi:hypothetical protein
MKTTIALLTASMLSLMVAIANAAPAPKAPVSGDTAVATCRDGTTMYAASNEHRGACRGHGGVASWTDGSPVRAKGGKRSYR